MSGSRTAKCPICGEPYKHFPFLDRDQSACPKCVAKAEKNMNYNRDYKIRQ
jgi:hypothetical protein